MYTDKIVRIRFFLKIKSLIFSELKKGKFFFKFMKLIIYLGIDWTTGVGLSQRKKVIQNELYMPRVTFRATFLSKRISPVSCKGEFDNIYFNYYKTGRELI